MISKSKLGAIAVIAAIGLASPAFAQYGSTGGGSPGYNAHNTTNYKLKKHHAKQHASVKVKEKEIAIAIDWLTRPVETAEYTVALLSY
jgi:hypothetical protein